MNSFTSNNSFAKRHQSLNGLESRPRIDFFFNNLSLKCLSSRFFFQVFFSFFLILILLLLRIKK